MSVPSFEKFNLITQIVAEKLMSRASAEEMLGIELPRMVEAIVARSTEPEVLFPYQEWEAKSEKRWRDGDKCSYCGSEWHPNRFRPGTCDSCGGPR